MLDIKKLLTKLLNRSYVIENSGNFAVALPASDSVTATKNVAKAGFTPVGVAGVHTSGTGASLGYIVGFWVANNIVNVTLRNTTATARNFNVNVDIIYKLGGVLHNLVTVNPCKGVAVC